MKYKYTYNKQTREYRVIRDNISTPPFKTLRDCKLSWKFLNTAVWTVDEIKTHTFKDTYNAKEESTNNKDNCNNN